MCDAPLCEPRLWALDFLAMTTETKSFFKVFLREIVRFANVLPQLKRRSKEQQSRK